MTKFYTFTNDKFVSTVQANNDETAIRIALSEYLRHQIRLNPLMAAKVFETLQQQRLSELEDSNITIKVYP